MKKFLKVFIPILAVGVMIAFAVCKAIIPEQTDLFIENVKILLDRPIVIAGFTITIGGIIIFVFTNYILKNTKFGKKELFLMKQEIADYKKEAENKAISLKGEVNNKLEELKAVKADCEGKITIMYSEFSGLKATMLDSLKSIPNKKVQEKVVKYEEVFEEKEQEFLKKTFDTNAYVDEKISKLELEWKEFVKQHMEIKDETEEAIDNKTTEE